MSSLAISIIHLDYIQVFVMNIFSIKSLAFITQIIKKHSAWNMFDPTRQYNFGCTWF
jgi:hypothetical protein